MAILAQGLGAQGGMAKVDPITFYRGSTFKKVVKSATVAAKCQLVGSEDLARWPLQLVKTCHDFQVSANRNKKFLRICRNPGAAAQIGLLMQFFAQKNIFETFENDSLMKQL